MATAALETPLAAEYASLLDKERATGLKPTDRYRAAASRLLERPEELVASFDSSVQQTTDYFARNDPGDGRFYGTKRLALTQPLGLRSTAAVSALMEDRRRQRWNVLGDDSLSFRYVDRELLVTQSKELSAPASPDVASLRLDLLLANAEDGLPIVTELKVTTERGSPDKNPFFALIQALACASYLLPPPQMARLRRHPGGRRLNVDDGRLDVYVLTVREPPASKSWFELRDAAERLSAATIADLGGWIRRIAFVELARLDKPSGGKRPPRVTKRFAVTA